MTKTLFFWASAWDRPAASRLAAAGGASAAGIKAAATISRAAGARKRTRMEYSIATGTSLRGARKGSRVR